MEMEFQKQGFRWKPLLGFLILIIVILILLFLPYQRKQAPKEFSPTGVAIPEKIYSYIGVLDSKDNGVLSITAKAIANYLTEDKKITVKLSSNAEMVRLVIPIDSPIGVPITPKQENISVNDLTIDQEVRVYSKNNIRRKTSFNAYRVEVVTFR